MIPFFVPETFAACLREPNLTPPASAPADLPKAVLKQVKPLGHEIGLLASALQTLKARLQKGRFSPELTAFLQSRWPNQLADFPSGGFGLVLREGPLGWRLVSGSPLWLNDPAFAALLHLPALRPTWAADMRASHLEHLRQIMPHAWFLDPTPLPPGSVIAGLGIPSWQHLPSLHGHGRVFEIHSSAPIIHLSDSVGKGEWQSAIQQALETSAILRERPSSGAWLLAHYTQGTGGTQFQAAWLDEAA
jgi:hypothetical protein